MILADERHNFVDTENTVEITRLSNASSLEKEGQTLRQNGIRTQDLRMTSTNVKGHKLGLLEL